MRILLEGYFDRNFGDDMMLRIVMDALQQHTFYSCVERRELLLPFRHVKNFRALAADDAVATFDVVLRVTGSGFMIHSKVGALYTLLRILAMRKAGKGLRLRAVIGCNIGPLKGRLATWLTDWELKQYGLITVRDSESERYLRLHRCKMPFEQYPDILFSLPDKWIPEQTGEGCLGISAYRATGDVEKRKNYHAYCEIAKLCDQYVAHHHKKVLLFAFDIEGENDLGAAYTIYHMCQHRDMLEIIAHTDDGSAVLRGYSRCSSVVGIRFHSIVLAMRMGLPFVPICYSKKTEAMLDDLGYRGPRFYYGSFCADSVCDALELAKPFEIESLSELAYGHIRAFEHALEKEAVCNDDKKA